MWKSGEFFKRILHSWKASVLVSFIFPTFYLETKYLFENWPTFQITILTLQITQNKHFGRAQGKCFGWLWNDIFQRILGPQKNAGEHVWSKLILHTTWFFGSAAKWKIQYYLAAVIPALTPAMQELILRHPVRQKAWVWTPNPPTAVAVSVESSSKKSLPKYPNYGLQRREEATGS